MDSGRQVMGFLYWHVVWAALEGKFAEALKWFEMMKHEVKGDPSLIENLTTEQRQVLKRCRDLVIRGESPRLLKRTTISPRPVRTTVQGTPCASEQELQRLLFFNPKILRECLGLPDLRLQIMEYSTFHGKVDILGRTNDLAVVIELKLGQADHAVVTQLEKYMLCEYHRLHYGDVRNVLGVVVADSYSDFADQELKKLNAVALRHTSFTRNRQSYLSLSPQWAL